MCGAGFVAGVHGEGDAMLAPTVEVAEGLEQERAAEALAAPGPERADRVDPAGAEAHGIHLRCDDLAAGGPDEVHDRRIPVVAPMLLPLAELAVDVSPVVGECLLGDCVNRRL